VFERFRKPRQCYRLGVGTDNADGSFTEGSKTPFTITASLQPNTIQPNGDAMIPLPEGRRSEETYVLFYQDDNPLQTVETSQTRNPDIVEIDGEEYECIETRKWRNDVISHWASVIARLQPEQ